MATQKQKDAARRNLEKARAAQRRRAAGKPTSRRPSSGLTTEQENRLDDADFAFPEQRKEPIHDAEHVRNAIARFDQVEDVSDADRDEAWRRIRRAARRFDIDVEAEDWRELFRGGKSRAH